MNRNSNETSTVACTCGRVRFEVRHRPVATVVCYCDDCQAGSAALAALPDAAPVNAGDGGTGYVLYRKDHLRCSAGSELLQDHHLDEKSATKRVVASCCNAAMIMRFDDIRHWVPIYRARFGELAPPVQWRICTKFKRPDVEIPGDVPAYETYPVAFMARLLVSGLATLFRIRR